MHHKFLSLAIKSELVKQHKKYRGNLSKYISCTLRTAGMLSLLSASNIALATDDTKGSIRGNVLDQEGKAMGDAIVTIVDESKGTTRTVEVGDNGRYFIPAINTGNYTITVKENNQTIYQRSRVNVSIGEKTTVNFDQKSALEEVVIEGKMTAIDTSSAVKDFVVNTSELMTRVPVPRDITSVAALAPTTAAADRNFANDSHDAPTISIGGASPAENACFINGLNTTNFRNGLGCSQVPFEFYEEIQIKNGGYNAEFGRSIGGVLNATTKSGSNEFEAGVNFFWEPQSLQGSYQDTYRAEGSYREDEKQNMDFWASGAIVEDRLFFYALVSPEKREKQREDREQITRSEWDDTFWALKLDFLINDNHSLEYTGFDDTRVEMEETFATDTKEFIGNTEYTRGGVNHALSYTGVITDWMVLSGQYGINEYDRTDRGSTDNNPAIIDERTSNVQNIGNWSNLQPSTKFDERKAWRIDADFYAGNHNIRVGVDNETNTASESTRYSGNIYYRYFSIGPGSTYDGTVADNGDVLSAGDEYVRVRFYENIGDFETLANAWYIQDEWSVNDQLTLHFGIRNESFENKNAEGRDFIKIDNQWAPRLGASFDPTGEGSSRIYANWGRYFLPIAANTNIRMAGAETFTADYYRLDGVNADSTPIFDEATHFDRDVFGTGIVPDTRSVVDNNIDPMYQDEIILGYEFDMFDEWRFGLKYTRRDLKSTIEDIAIDAAVIDYYNTNGGWSVADATVEEVFGGFHQYVLTNPGFDMEVYIPETDETISLSAEQLGYPEAKRVFQALEFSFDREWDDKWLLSGSLVLSETTGNHEGYVKSDNGQDDAGITTSFDQPGLTDGSDGKLPSDRPWAFKTWASYKMDMGLSFGAKISARSGRPINCIGVHPTDDFAGAYGAESFFCGGQLTPRGSVGRTPTSWELGLSTQYTFELGDSGELTLRGDVYNALNNDKAVEVLETGENDSGTVDTNYRLPSSYQLPRTVRLSATYKF